MRALSTIIFLILGIMLMPIHTTIVDSVPADPNEEYPYQTNEYIIQNALQYLRNQQSSDGSIGGFSTSAWATMAFAAADEHGSEYEKVKQYLHDAIDHLDEASATDGERYALAVTACNENPRDFEGIDFVENIEGCFDGTQLGNTATIYDDVFGVLALRSCGVHSDAPIIQELKTYVLSQQRENGGWGDVDATSAAVMALVAAGTDPGSASVCAAVTFLKTQQTESGGFTSWGTANAASTAWAIDALVAAGQNPTSESWIVHGKSPVDFLVSLQRPDGGFDWAPGKRMNSEWMTSYIIPALLGRPFPVNIFTSGCNDESATYCTSSAGEVWTGRIRIEGKNSTIWDGAVNVSESSISAFNESSGQTEIYNIPFPSVLGALEEAANIGQFSLDIMYYPSWQAFYVKAIAGYSDWWHYWVDYSLPMVDAGHYALSGNDSEVLFGYLEDWNARALRITVDREIVAVSDDVHVRVFNETLTLVTNASVCVDTTRYSSDMNGVVTFSISAPGQYAVYAEKNGFVRSEKLVVQVKSPVEIVKPKGDALYMWNHLTRSSHKTSVVIGQIDIEVDAPDDVRRVDFFVDGELRYTDTESPFAWRFNERCFGKKVTIQVIGYILGGAELLGMFDSDSVEMSVFNCFPRLHSGRFA